MKKISAFFAKLTLILTVSSLILSSCNTGNTEFTPDKLLTGLSNDVPQPAFMWGVSTAGYQNEGYDTSSIWHAWELSGKTQHRNFKGSDFLNRYQEDLDLAKNMGINSFRISIEWSRIEPVNGTFDPAGIQFYHNLLNAIKARGMTPLVTLVHFNYPQWIVNEDRNNRKGLESSDFVKYYLRYVDKVVREYGADIKYYLTFNEPNIWVPGAYLLGMTPPGKHNPFATVRAAWNLLKAHSKAYDLIHSLDPDAMVSANVWYLEVKPFTPVTPAPGSAEITASVPGRMLDEKNMEDTDWFYESVETGRTTVNPAIFLDDGEVPKAEMKPLTLADDLRRTDALGRPFTGDQEKPRGDSMFGWLKKFDYVSFDYYYNFRNIHQVLNITKVWEMEIYPKGIYDAITFYQRKYGKPIIVAENGIGTEDLKPRPDGWTRESGLVEHIKYLQQARAEGANVLGYFHWSLTDNYEWGSFTPRFGLYKVDALNDPELKRIPTPAVEIYGNIIRNNGVTAELAARFASPVK
jgi:beta-glucosidase